MAIESLRISEFTVFKDFEIEFNKGVNVIIGANGTGKTHLLKMLYTNDFSRHDTTTDMFLKIWGEDSGFSKSKWSFKTSSTPSPALEGHMIFFDNQENPFASWHVIRGEEHLQDRQDTCFIPSKDMLTHGRLEKDAAKRDLPFDKTLFRYSLQRRRIYLKRN